MVYFIQAGNNGPIKIGVSSVPQMHLDRLQQGNHEELRLIAEIPGERSLEQKVQTDLKAFELERKWFHATGEVLDYIKKIQEEPLVILWRGSEFVGPLTTKCE